MWILLLPCFGIGHNLSLICQMTSEDIKHQLIIIIIQALVYDIFPPTSAVADYVTGLEKLSANEQFFDDL